MKVRLLRGIGANVYGQAVTTLIQVASVPLLMKAWGVPLYGVWVLLAAIPAGLAFVDGGLVLVSGTAMTMAIARGDNAAAAGLFRRSLLVVTGALVLVGAVVGTILSCLPPALLSAIIARPPSETRLVLEVLTAVTLLGVLTSLPGAVLRADGRYAFGVVASSTARLVESLAVFVTAAWGAGLPAAALAWLATRLMASVLLFLIVARLVSWCRTPAKKTAVPVLRPLLHPALASVAIPAAFTINLQGISIALGFALPAEAVAVFSAVRTLARAAVQLSGLVNHALMPELTRIAGRGDLAAMGAVSRFNNRVTLALMVPAWAVIMAMGPGLVTIWTGGRVHPDPFVLPLVATAALVHGIWLSQANLLLAINRQADYAWMFLAITSAAALLAWPAARQAGVPGAAAVGLLSECGMALWLWSLGRSRRFGTGLAVGAIPS